MSVSNPLLPLVRALDDFARRLVAHTHPRRWMALLAVAIVGMLYGAAGRGPAPALESLEPVALHVGALHFDKSVPDGKPEARAEATAPTLAEMETLIGWLRRSEHMRVDAKKDRRIAAAILLATQRWPVDPVQLMALGWIESRLRPEAESGSGACGLFQQLPRYARPMPTPCHRLHVPELAAYHAGAFIRSYERRWGAGWPCHYNGGMVCGARAIAYAVRLTEVTQALRKELVRLREPAALPDDAPSAAPWAAADAVAAHEPTDPAEEPSAGTTAMKR
jgi:hypothetical protein